MFRRRMIGQPGTSPADARRKVPDNPARGKAQGRTRLPGRTCAEEADRRRESKPRSRRHPIPGRLLLQIAVVSNRRSVTPTKINRGGRGRHERQVGPDRQKCRNAKSTTVCSSRRHVKQAWRVHPDVG